jgi:hypothetical protein
MRGRSSNASGVRGRGLESRWGCDVRGRARREDPLGEFAVPPLADFDGETLVLRRPQVMAELLTRDAEP